MHSATHESLTVSAFREGFGILWGSLLLAAGLLIYIIGVVFASFSHLFAAVVPGATEISRTVIWYGGIPVFAGLLLAGFEILVLVPLKRRTTEVPFDFVQMSGLTVVLTALNDEESIGDAVRDFRAHPLVRRVLVIDNNSRDKTALRAKDAGATVIIHQEPGYGQCVYRALREASAYPDTELTLLCEGDRSFRAFDVDKFMAYISHAEIVNGTRIVAQLRSPRTQLTTFMYYGNFAVGKLLELKHLGRGTLTDVGTTYKLVRNSALVRLLPQLNREVNLEFNAHFLDRALELGIGVVECPVTFHSRVGVSKGGNVSNGRALKVGLRMIAGILFGWKEWRQGQ
jgi:glycosyltransferase involved in cell wall biosynthesis